MPLTLYVEQTFTLHSILTKMDASAAPVKAWAFRPMNRRFINCALALDQYSHLHCHPEPCEGRRVPHRVVRCVGNRESVFLSDNIISSVRCVVLRLLSALLVIACLPNPLLALQADPNTSAVPDREQARELLLHAAALINEIPELQRSSAAANIAGQLTRAGDFPSALKTIHLLKKPAEQTSAAGSIAWQLANSGNLPQALALIQGSKKDESEELSSQQDFCYEIVAKLLADKKDFDGGIRTAHLIQGPQRLGDTLVQIAISQAKAGEHSAASRLLSEAIEVAEKGTKINDWNAMVFTQIAAAQLEMGVTPETSLALQRFSVIAHKKKEEGDFSFLQHLAATQARIGDVTGAMLIIQELDGSGPDLPLMSLSEQLAQRGFMAEAFAAVARISSPWSKYSALREIAMLRRTDSNLNDSLEAIGKIEKASDRAEALANLALQQAEHHDPGAYLTLQLWYANSSNGPDEEDHARQTVAVTYGLLADFVSAEQIVRAMPNPESRMWPLWNLTAFLAKSGDTQQALNLAQEEEAAYPKAYALLGTAQGILDHIESEAKAHAQKH